MQRLEYRSNRKEEKAGEHGQQDGQQQTALHTTGNAFRIPCPHRLRHHRIEHHQRARRRQHSDVKAQVAQRDAAERRRRNATDHQRIDDAHCHEAHLRRDDWQRNAEHGGEFCAVRKEHRARRRERVSKLT